MVHLVNNYFLNKTKDIVNSDKKKAMKLMEDTKKATHEFEFKHVLPIEVYTVML